MEKIYEDGDQAGPGGEEMSDRWTSDPQDLVEFAWLIIAGAMGVGDPPVDPIPGWHEAACRWRDLYHEYLRLDGRVE